VTPLPRILVIDDVLGQANAERNLRREDFCVRLGLQDVTGDVQAEPIDAPVAEAVFCRAQRVIGNTVENDVAGTLDRIRQGWVSPPRWALILLDLHFSTGPLSADGEVQGRPEDRVPACYFGLQLLTEARRDPLLAGLPVTILSSMERRDVERLFADLEVFDFADKSRIDHTWLADQLFHYGLLEDEVIVGRSLSLLECMREARRRSQLKDENILILGETGVGKELFVDYIHAKSGRQGSLVRFFPQAVPETLMESHLFGHEKGAFTGASDMRPGAAEVANGGTLFIDEFGDIPRVVQAKLLRLLDPEVREAQRLGSAKPQRLDLLVVMATNRIDIGTSDNFRSDLLARAKANIDTLLLPTLRERREDIPLLALYFVRHFEREIGAEEREISQEAMAALVAYDWPENVRELEAELKRAVSTYPGIRHLSEAHLQIINRKTRQISAPLPRGARNTTGEFASRELESRKVCPDLDELIQIIGGWVPDSTHPASLAGVLPKLEEAYHRLLVRCLKAGIEATRRPTPGCPEGEINRQLAMRLLTGDATLKGSQPADRIKDLLNRNQKARDEALHDQVLRQLYEASERLRKSKKKPKPDP